MDRIEFSWNKFLLVLGLSILLFSLVESNGHKQKFGDSCSKNKKCDFTKWLRCGKGNKCECYQTKNLSNTELYYEAELERCVGKSGTNCSQKFYPFGDEDAYYFHMRGPTTNHWRYGNGSLRCGSNAVCENDGPGHFCKCQQNYFETEDGKCLKLKKYQDSCTVNKECDPDAFLSCNNGICLCEKPENHLYDPRLEKCVVLAGLECEERNNRFDGSSVDDCVMDSSCVNNICRCNYGTQIHSNRTCQRGHGHECGPDHPCGDSKLNCRSKVCQCKFPLHMKYDEISGQCMGIASGPCVFNDTSELAIQCTKNAECVQRGLHSECRCKSGFLQTADGDCVQVYGSDCDMTSDCDPFGPLACINGQCECQDLLLTHDSKSRRCKGLVGSRCKIGEDSCIEHSTCTKFEEITAGNMGRCLCNRGFKETAKRICSNH